MDAREARMLSCEVKMDLWTFSRINEKQSQALVELLQDSRWSGARVQAERSDWMMVGYIHVRTNDDYQFGISPEGEVSS